MRFSTFAVLALVCLAFSGCVSSTGPVTAKQVVGKATDLGHKWNKDAQLFVLGTVEAKASMADSAPANSKAEIKALLAKDDAKVDGKASEWHFMFGAGGKLLILVLDGAGHESFRNETTDSTGGLKPLTDWSVDSDLAMKTAQGNETFAKALPSADLVALTLWDVGSGPVWLAGAAISFTQMGTTVAIDAKTGAAMSASKFLTSRVADAASLAQEKGRVSTPQMSPLSPAAPDATGTFDIKTSGHDRLNFTLTASTPGPVNTLTATVKGPDGKETKLDAAGPTPSVPPTFPPTGGAAPVKVTLPTPTAGTYTVSFHLSGGATQTGRLDWCTDGKPGSSTTTGGGRGGGANTAC